MITIQNFVNEFRKLEGKGARFIGFNYTNKEGELSKRVVNVGVSYENMLKKDLEILKTVSYTPSPLYTKADWDLAKAELKKSLENSLDPAVTNARSEAQKDAYIWIADGLRWHIDNKELHITGASHSKTVIVAGTYKTVNSRAKTIAKNDIKKNLKSDKYRTFVIKNLSGTLKINGDTIDID